MSAWIVSYSRGDAFTADIGSNELRLVTANGIVAICLPSLPRIPSEWFSESGNKTIRHIPVLGHEFCELSGDKHDPQLGPSLGKATHAWGFGIDLADTGWRIFYPPMRGSRYGATVEFVPAFGVVVPHWFLAVLCLLCPFLWWRRRRRLLSIPVAMCPVCNYDLRGTPGRCPECGWKQTGAVTPPSSPPS